MSKVTVTYNAPKGDEKVVEMRGVTFFDGQAVEIEDPDEQKEFLDKMVGNPHFDVDGYESEAAPRRRGRPPKTLEHEPRVGPRPEPVNQLRVQEPEAPKSRKDK